MKDLQINPYQSDEKIIELLHNKDNRGYSLLYAKYWKPLVSYAYSFLEEYDAAQEIVQNLMVSFFTNDITLNSKYSLYAYLQKAVRNRVTNYCRDRHNYEKHVTKQPVNVVVSTDVITSSLLLAELRRNIRRCLDKLPRKYAEVFLLNREDCMTVKEIAIELNRPEGTVEKQLRKSLQFLRENLDSDFYLRMNN